MKRKQAQIFLLLFIIPFSINCHAACKKITINGKITFTAIYKDGARPTPEVLEACCTAKPMVNAKLYLKKNYYSKVLYTITTDARGNFKKRLKTGSYKVFLKNEVNDVKAEEIADGKSNQNNAWLTEPYFVINVVADKSEPLMFDLRERRDPNEIQKP